MNLRMDYTIAILEKQSSTGRFQGSAICKRSYRSRKLIANVVNVLDRVVIKAEHFEPRKDFS